MKQKRWKVDPSLHYGQLVAKVRNMTTAQIAIALFIAVWEMEREAPTLAEIEQELGISRSTIERAMPRLREAGLIAEA